MVLTGPEDDGDVVVDLVDFPRLRTDISYARIPDGVGEWRPSSLPTPRMRNRLGDTHYK